MEFIDVWLQNFPSWGACALFTPIIFMAPKLIPIERLSIPNFIFRHLGFFILVILSYWATVMVLTNLVQRGFLNLTGTLSNYSNVFFSNVQIDIVVYVAILFTRYCYIYYERSKQQSLRNEKLASQLVKVELQALRSQLNPHFLFNTLNTITSLIRLEKSDSAITALSELGLMLRRVLENQNNQMVTVRQEMEFIHSFLTIQKMRCGDKIDISITVNPECLDLQLPFMLLQPLIENAVQHGSQLQTDSNLIQLEIYRESWYLKVKLTNQMSRKKDHKGFGIGIKNCRQRMEMLYGDDFELTLSEEANDLFVTNLSIPVGVYND